MDTIADRLRALRAKKGVSQDVVAEACDLSRVALTRYESGARIPVAGNVAKLASYYGVTVDYLLGREEAPPAPEQPKRTFMIYGRTYNGRTMQEMYEELPPAQQAAIERLVTVLFAESRKEGE